MEDAVDYSLCHYAQLKDNYYYCVDAAVDPFICIYIFNELIKFNMPSHLIIFFTKQVRLPHIFCIYMIT